jgi:hypothetical protein
LSTSLVSPRSLEQVRAEELRQEYGFAATLATALTFTALLVHGYHPYAEDGGVYLPEIKRLVDPALYPHGAEFVVGHLRYSLFAPMIASLARAWHVRVETVLFATYLATFWTMLFATWLLAARCYKTRVARSGAVGLVAVWITLPIAGTSLMLMDPYVTARSLSSPCALLALVGALDALAPEEIDRRRRARGLLLCCVALVASVAMHPLMGAYAVGSVLLLAAARSQSRITRLWGMPGLGLTALVVASGLTLAAPPESVGYRQVVLTRYYWFLSCWHWYEWIGAIAPLLILSFAAMQQREDGNAARIVLARMAVGAGVIAILVALLFARPGMETHLVARLQPLRIFQLVYVVMILELGSMMAERVLKRSVWRWVAAFSLLATVMIGTERSTFPHSSRIEMTLGSQGWSGGANAWEQAYVWISRNTPKNALFAQDGRYITQPGEDAQSFRAVAERSALPDFSKDGGVVSNKPELATMWQTAQQAQTMLNEETDAERIAALKPFGANWVILERSAPTAFVCEYANAAVKVCRLP